MFQKLGNGRKLLRRTRRRARVLWRSVLLHGVILVLLAVGLLVRLTESSDERRASLRRATAIAAIRPHGFGRGEVDARGAERRHGRDLVDARSRRAAVETAAEPGNIQSASPGWAGSQQRSP